MTDRVFSPTLHRRSLLRLAGEVAGVAGLGMLAACGGAVTASTTSTGSSRSAGTVSAVAPMTGASAATSATAAATTSASSAPQTSAAGTSSTASAAAAPAGVANVVGWFNIDPSNQQAWTQAGKEFETQHPDVKVTLNPLAGHTTDQEAKLLSIISGGSAADLIYVHPIYNAAFATKGVIVPLEPYLDRSKGAIDLTDFYAGTVDYFRWTGKLWALPNSSFPGVYYYNTDILKRQGLADPWALYQKGTWTIQEMDGDVAKVVSGQGATKVFARDDISHSIRFQSPWIQGFGGQVWNADTTKTLLDGDGAIKGWEYLASQVTKGFAPASADLKGLTNGIHTLFADGRLAFYFGLRSDVPSFKSLPFGTAPVHAMPDGKYYNRDGPNGVGITQASKVKDAAWQFTTFDLSRGVELLMAAGFSAPTTRTLAKSPVWLNQLIPGETQAAYAAAAEQVRAIPLPVRTIEIDNVIQGAYAKMLKGQATAKAAMAEVVPQINSMLTTAGQ